MERASNVTKKTRVRKSKRESQRRFRRFVSLSALLLIGLIIVNIKLSSSFSGIVAWFNTEYDYNDSAQMVALFIQTEYSRQIEENGQADIYAIIKKAKKLDRKLTIKYFTNTEDRQIVSIFLDLDTKTISLESFELESRVVSNGD